MLIPNERGAATGRFDWKGFVVTGLASFGLMYSLESIARNRIDWRITVPLLAASVFAAVYGIRHARRVAHPLLDLTPFALPTFAITVGGGLLVSAAISAAPFLLPLACRHRALTCLIVALDLVSYQGFVRGLEPECLVVYLRLVALVGIVGLLLRAEWARPPRETPCDQPSPNAACSASP